MRSSSKLIVVRKLAVMAAIAAPLTSAMATNGMLMEGYGPISTGMGGTSQAISHGTAAMAQNPATLGMLGDGATLEVAAGVLGPKVTSSMMGMDAKSGGTSYLMPAFGYARKSGALTYGVGMFAQGGMGTEYEASAPFAMGSGALRSELGVGNVIIPVAYQVSSALTIGATLDYMWSSLDLQMALPTSALGPGGLVTGTSGNLGGALASGALNTATFARISFSDDSKFSGAAKSTGYAAKIGATFKVNKDVVVGGSYRLKSKLADMQTSGGAATMSANPGGAAITFSDTGSMTVVDFQMPAVLALGASWQVQPSLLLAADVKSIAWGDSMKSFKMRYNSAVIGGSVSFELPQNWKDQTVINLGLAWQATNEFTLRAGLNLADNPVPDTTVNYLFPATVKNHATMGMGYKISKQSDFNASLTLAPASDVTAGSGISISHAQTNVQLMFSQRF
jgi:long-chain fatty acid transport protein